MSVTSKRRGPGNDLGPYLGVALCGLVIAGVAAAWTSAAAGAALGGQPAPSSNPFDLVFALASGAYRWPGAWATAVLVAELLVLAVAAVFIGRLIRKAKAERKPIDAAARHLGRGADIAKITERGARATAERLGTQGGSIGVFLGRTVIGNTPVYQGVEDTQVAIWGTRTGKTTRVAIPAVMEHQAAPCIATTNRRDLVDATRLGRAEYGTVRVYDPQQIVGEEPTWYWDPLSYVTDVTTSVKLAGVFATNSREQGSSTDAYFGPASKRLVANLLLAAALDQQPITQVYRWVNDSTETEPERILRAAGPEYEMAAESLSGALNLTERQRSGVYGGAQTILAFLEEPKITRWAVAPVAADLGKRQPFSPQDFVRSTDTLYLVSREGEGSAAALVTALTVAICEAAEQYAMRSPNGRLPRTLLAVLDEAANICKWADLPDLYSHYGSRGILPITILQNWDQGITTWGESGMKKLFGSANVATYGGGSRDPGFLGHMVSLLPEFHPLARSVSRQAGTSGALTSNRSTSISSTKEDLVNISDLVQVPGGRALLFASQTHTTLVRTIPYWEHPWADKVRASLDRYDPGGQSADSLALDEPEDDEPGTP
ncbi:TraM recognition domain-containing protein [Streptomyces sp. NPDC047525]|uniref:type IV secretory system conjugative DNA transfer family protein n=1 Tax=Streptomyces sp. NPDC047525 TaxID=3155264 RepID=UPI00340A3338